MKISPDAVQKILGLNKHVPRTSLQMARGLKVTCFPFAKGDKEVDSFKRAIMNVLRELKVEILPYEETLTKIRGSLKVKSGIIVLVFGESIDKNLAIDHVETFDNNPVVTVISSKVDFDGKKSSQDRIDRGFELLSWYGPNIILCVNKGRWMIYSMNGVSPIYKVDEKLKTNVSRYLIPKLSTKVSPPKLADFNVGDFSKIHDEGMIQGHLDDLTTSGPVFSKAEIFPPMKELKDLNWRSHHYCMLASVFLDKRNGVSFGFLAKQLQLKLPAAEKYNYVHMNSKFGNNDYYDDGKKLHVLLHAGKDSYVVDVPPVWVLMSRSGCEKTKLNPGRDVLKVGLIKGELLMDAPSAVSLDQDDYRPSFDTRVILSHCIGNAIVASVMKRINKKSPFVRTLEKEGLALCHWHGDLPDRVLPEGWFSHGRTNLPVLCSSFQSAIYALEGKLKVFGKSINRQVEYYGDLHVEPHHGANMTGATLRSLGKFFLSVQRGSFEQGRINNDMMLKTDYDLN